MWGFKSKRSKILTRKLKHLGFLSFIHYSLYSLDIPLEHLLLQLTNNKSPTSDPRIYIENENDGKNDFSKEYNGYGTESLYALICYFSSSDLWIF